MIFLHNNIKENSYIKTDELELAKDDKNVSFLSIEGV
jgi:hypothetical protein